MGPARQPFLLARDLTDAIPADRHPPSLSTITPAPVELGTASPPPVHCARTLTRQPALSCLIPGVVRHHRRRCAPRRRQLVFGCFPTRVLIKGTA
jgi:hypothetical protein